jgi:hypothetical protein
LSGSGQPCSIDDPRRAAVAPDHRPISFGHRHMATARPRGMAVALPARESCNGNCHVIPHREQDTFIMTKIQSEHSNARAPRHRLRVVLASMAVVSMAVASTGSAGAQVPAPTPGAPAVDPSALDAADMELAAPDAPGDAAAAMEPVAPGAGEVEPDSLRPLSLIRHYTFQVSMPVFLRARQAQVHRNILDWHSDGCSHVSNHPGGFNFLPSCERHDFGSRNYKRQHACNEHIRKEIDDNFHKDMYNVCSKFSGIESWKGVECRRFADIYYFAVRNLGNCK